MNYSTNTNENERELLNDGGCDTSVVGNGFIVDSHINRSVDVQGFIDSKKVDCEDEVIYLKLNEYIAVRYN